VTFSLHLFVEFRGQHHHNRAIPEQSAADDEKVDSVLDFWIRRMTI
jgi:hypothetical protein